MSGAPGHKEAERLLRDLGVLAYLEAAGRPAAAEERDRVMESLRQLEANGQIGPLTVSPPAPPTPPPPGAAAAGYAAPPPPSSAPPPPPQAPAAPAPPAQGEGVIPPGSTPPPPPPSWGAGS
jgi:hypothetical protein